MWYETLMQPPGGSETELGKSVVKKWPFVTVIVLDPGKIIFLGVELSRYRPQVKVIVPDGLGPLELVSVSSTVVSGD